MMYSSNFQHQGSHCIPINVLCHAGNYYSVIANMRGESAEEVAGKILASERLRGLQGPTISPVFTPSGSNGAAAAEPNLFGTTICVPKKQLYASVNELRKVGSRAKMSDQHASWCSHVPTR